MSFVTEWNEEEWEGVFEVCIKVKVKLFLCFFLTEHHAVKVYWGVEV
jgi:hypothetical protein